MFRNDHKLITAEFVTLAVLNFRTSIFAFQAQHISSHTQQQVLYRISFIEGDQVKNAGKDNCSLLEGCQDDDIEEKSSK